MILLWKTYLNNQSRSELQRYFHNQKAFKSFDLKAFVFLQATGDKFQTFLKKI